MKWQRVYGHKPQVVFGERFDEGRDYTNWRPEGSGDHLMLFTVGGCGQVGNRSVLRTVKAGDVVLFESGAEQVYLTDPEAGRWIFLWCHFLPRQGWSHTARWPLLGEGVRLVSVGQRRHRDAVRKALEEMVHWVRQPGPNAHDFALNAVERAFLWIGRDHAPERKLDPRIQKAMEGMSREVSRPFDLGSVARTAGLSVSRLAHLFREQTGMTPREYAEEQKMRHGAQLLRLTSLPVAEVAERCGFENAFYFSTRFSRWSNLSPRAFRSQAGRG